MILVMTDYVNIFKELILITLGLRDGFSINVSEKAWRFLFKEANKQSLVGVLFLGIEKLKEEQMPPKLLRMEWLRTALLIESQNNIQYEKVQELSDVFMRGGVGTCVLKGQGMALLYPNPLRRQCGDIDLWVNCDRDKAVKFCQERWEIDHVDIKNLVINTIPYVHLEVHFIPSWFYSPFTDRKFRNWYKQQWDEQFKNKSERGFYVPTISFNLVYCLVHIYKHMFDEGIGMRQLMDYYYIILHSSKEEREQAFSYLKKFRTEGFCSAVMYVMVDFFAMKDEFLLCAPSNRLGKKLENTILIGGNFGQHDKRNSHGRENRMSRGLRNLKHNFALLLDYPSEVIWSPIWKCWHWLWRKKRGFL